MIDVATRDPVEAARGADLIVLAVPIMTMRSTLEKMIAHAAPDAVVTDVGSVKEFVVRELEPSDHGKTIACRGASGGRKGNRRRGVCRPGAVSRPAGDYHASAKSTPDAINKIEQLWSATGACVEMMDPRLHDAVARAREPSAADRIERSGARRWPTRSVGDKLAAEYGASGLRDTTRLAGSSWEMWRDIFITNREAIAAALKLLRRDVCGISAGSGRGRCRGLEKIFERGKRMREKIR